MKDLTAKTVLQFVFSYGGRIKRIPFVLGECLSIVPAILLVKLQSIAILDGPVINTSPAVAFLIFGAIIFVLWFHWVLMIKRLHDVNLSGWLSLIYCVPFVNLFFLLFLIFKAPVDPNKYEITPRKNFSYRS